MGALLSQAIARQLAQYPGSMNPEQPPLVRLQNMLRPPGPVEPSIAGQGLQDISPVQQQAMNFAMGLEGGIKTGPLDPEKLKWLEGMPGRKVTSMSEYETLRQLRDSQDLIEQALKERAQTEQSFPEWMRDKYPRENPDNLNPTRYGQWQREIKERRARGTGPRWTQSASAIQEELEYCRNLIRSGGDQNVPRSSIRSYIEMQAETMRRDGKLAAARQLDALLRGLPR